MKDLLGLIGKTIRQYDGRDGHFREFSILRIEIKDGVISFHGKPYLGIYVTPDMLSNLLAHNFVTVTKEEDHCTYDLTVEIED